MESKLVLFANFELANEKNVPVPITNSDSFLFIAIHPHRAIWPSSIAVPPTSSEGPAKKWVDGPISSPSISHHKHHHKRKKFHSSAPEPTYSRQGSKLWRLSYQ